MKFFLLLLTPFLFFGCVQQKSSQHDANTSELERALEKTQRLEKISHSRSLLKMQIEAEHEKELAAISMKKELATIDREKTIKLAELEAKLEVQRLALERERVLEELRQAEIIRENERHISEQRNYLLFASLIVLIVAAALYYFFKRRREDKLRAYNDNLEKYFQNKQNESRVKIAEKIIDTIASGKLNTQQESQLIEALNGQNRKHDELQGVDDADIIEALPENPSP